MRKFLYVTDLNPEPWAMPTIGVARRGSRSYPVVSKNGIQEAYQEGLKQSIQTAYPNLEMFGDDEELCLEIYLWRSRDSYKTATGQNRVRQTADATNIQKATEDALQGILFKNDTQVKRVTTEIVYEGRDTKPALLIICQPRVYPNPVAISMVEQYELHLAGTGGNVLYAELN